MKSILAVAATIAAVVAIARGQPQHYSQAYNVVTGPTYAHAASPGVVHDPTAPNPRNLAHRAVVENAAVESQLPQELINPFYKNPNIAAGLAKESWFGNKEFPVFHRQADRISRQEIIKLVHRIEHQRR